MGRRGRRGCARNATTYVPEFFYVLTDNGSPLLKQQRCWLCAELAAAVKTETTKNRGQRGFCKPKAPPRLPNLPVSVETVAAPHRPARWTTRHCTRPASGSF